MNGLLEMLLGLRTLRLGERGVEFGFRFPLAAWEWAAVAILCGLAGWWSYRRLDAARPGRVALAVVRALLLVLLVFLATGPRLQRPNDTLERDWVLMLVDRSASMRVADGPKGPDGARQTREAELKAALARHRPAFDEIAKGRVVLWSGFDGGLVDLKPATSATGAPVELMAPDGARSDLGLALERMTARAAARPLSGVVVFSDGRSTDTPSRAVQRRLATLRVPIITVPLGSAEALGDAAVRSVDAPGVAFVGDAVPIQATIERNGAAARGRARVELVNTVTGEVLDRRDIDAVSDAEADGVHQDRVTLTTTPGVAGETQWAVRVVPEGDDLAQENNSVPLRIALTDRPLRVLYLDGYPRWEYRYLQAVLSRERSMSSTAWLLSGGRRFIQEGNTPIDALPTTTEPPYPVIPSRPGKLAQIFESVPETLARATVLLEQITLLFSEENRAAITDTLANLQSITEKLDGSSGDVTALLTTGTEAAQNISKMSQAVETLANDLGQNVGQIGGNVDAAVSDLRSMSQSFTAVANQLDLLLTDNQQPISDFATIGLYEATQMLTEIRLLVAQLQRVAAQFERDPARFLFGDRQEGFETQP